MAPPAYCVRRDTLDPLLQSAAQGAGAELRFRHKVVDLVHAGERVSGVVVQTPAGRETLHADLVVGADGFRSTIARLTAAPTYLTEESTRAGYWSYYRAPATWSQPWDAMLEHRGQELRYVFRANGDLIVLVYVGPKADVASWGPRLSGQASRRLRALAEHRGAVRRPNANRQDHGPTRHAVLLPQARGAGLRAGR